MRKNRHRKNIKIIAWLLIVTMISGTPLETLAMQSLDTDKTKTIVEESVEIDSVDTATEVGDADESFDSGTQTPISDALGDQITESIDANATEDQGIELTAVDDEEEDETEKTDFRVEEGSVLTEEVNAPLATAVSGQSADEQPSLTLQDAKSKADSYKTSNNLTNAPIKENDDGSWSVYEGAGLVLLSNVKPEEYQNLDFVLLATGEGWDLTVPYTFSDTAYSFLGLGNTEKPYSGNLSVDDGSKQKAIKSNIALFHALSETAELSTNITFMMDGVGSNQPVLADIITRGESKATLDCNITLTKPTGGDSSLTDTFGGIIGILKEGTHTSVTLRNTFTGALTVSGGEHRGLFCNTLEAGSSLTASLDNSGGGTIQIIASSGDAGGCVGHMNENTALTVSGDSVSTVTSQTGNAGGLVGSAVNSTINTLNTAEGLSGVFSLSGVTVTAAYASGGLVGDYTNSVDSALIDLSKFIIDTNLSGGSNAGGVFGAFKNSGSYTISGKTVNSKLSSATDTNTYGGLIGSYQADALTNTLSISGITENSKTTNLSISSSGGNNATNYGGVFGKVVGPSYVSVENVTVTTADMPVKPSSVNPYDFFFGGLVGIAGGNDADTSGSPMLNVGDVKLITSDDNDIADVSDVKGRGGLIGYFIEGVLRLHGTTDLSEQTMTKPLDTGAAPIIGQIVGYNDNGFVYGVGDGNGNYNGTGGWQLTRYNGVKTSDIGTWGQVIRLDGVNLSEGNTSDTDLLYFDSTNHTVTVKSSFQEQNGEIYDISTLRDFAAYVLGFNYSGVNGGTLMFSKSVAADDIQTVNITADIDLTGTGILGIGRDFGIRTNDKLNITPCGPMFRGTINGMISETSKSKITLDIGHSSFGTIGSVENASDDVCSGGIKVWDVVDKLHCHAFLGLVAVAGDSVTIKNLEIAGDVMALGSDRNQTWQGFVAGGVALATGNISFDNVMVSADISANGFRSYYQAGFVAAEKGTGKKLSFKDCTWQGTLYNASKAEVNMIGGLIAHANYNQTVTVSGCTLSGTLEARGTKNTTETGGLIAHFEPNKDNCSSIALCNLEVKNAKIDNRGINNNTATAKGGVLGYSWPNTNVTFGGTDTSGVTISGCTLEAGNTQFGGLVYQATGYWNVTANNSIKFVKGTDSDTTNSISGSTSKDDPSGLLVYNGLMTINNEKHALYLEVGTFGEDGASYYIKNGAVSVTQNEGDYFDELVGKTIDDISGNNNAVVSIAVRGGDGTAAKIDAESTCNTYTGQLGVNYKNDKTRYYYNLDSYRIQNGETVSANSLDSAGDVVSWSVSQYAASNIRNRFCTNANKNAIISGNIDLTGYSYYPVTPLAGVTVGSDNTQTTLQFAFDAMNAVESEENNSNKPLDDSTHQHYLMHHGLLYNTDKNVAVKNTTFAGTVGLQRVNNSTNSGALIFGSVSGDPTKDSIKIELTNVILAGLRVANWDKDTITYAPLLVNKISQATKLTVIGLSTGKGYVADAYAATSLIGNVGSDSASKLTLLFSNIALDGRTETAEGDIKVYNNGSVPVIYNTTHSIFTRATLLESFQYQSEGSGLYNFNSTDSKVTYGVELSNSGEIGRNPGKQYKYYDTGYVTDVEGKTGADENYVKGRYTSKNFVRYVGILENYNNNSSYHEIDINLKVTGLTEGCGTYGDPYLISTPDQLISLAKFFTGTGADGLEVKFNSKVLDEKKQTSGSYHLNGSAQSDETGYDYIYTYSNSSWSSADENAGAIDKDIACLYLQNAYYQIQTDIELSAKEFIGIGTSTTPFCGVIVGLNQNTIKFVGTNEDTLSYGFIKFSQGSVIKDLTVDYSEASIKMSNTAVPSSSNNPFFGGVVGYCMGGDTIIDNVSVNYKPVNSESSSVTLSGSKSRLIAAGGYVGLVGGAKETASTNTGYEKTGGGVVFRNMSENTNNFADYQTNAKTDTSYFFCNPYVGRVLDGYACYDTQKEGSFITPTLDNTDKNYTIPNLVMENTKGLLVDWDDTNKVYSATVNNAQGLWLLSAIVNSGAGAMDNKGIYQDVENKFVEAYQYGKVRSGSYDQIGDAKGSSDLADEVYWGGIPSPEDTDEAKARVSYLVKKYTTTYASHLTGRSITSGNNAKNSSNNPIALTFATREIDMTPYGNGFRGIGGSYGYIFNLWDQANSVPQLYRRSLLVKNINYQDSSAATGETNSVTTIIMNMNQKEYYEQNSNTTYESGWWNHGVGLFPEFSYSENCTVHKLTLKGNVRLTMHDMDGNESLLNKKDYDAFVGGFAGRVVNSKDALNFNTFSLIDLNIYGGTASGGAIGCIDGTGGAKNVFFNSFRINTVNVKKKVYHDGSTGGLLGWNRKSNITIGASSSATISEVNTLEVSATADTVTYANAGGLVGASDSNNVTIQNVKVDTLSVTGTNTRDIGGLIASFRSGGTLTISNCELNNITITGTANAGSNSDTSDRNVGGIVGYVNQKVSKFSNVKIRGNSKMKATNCCNLGGMIGYTSQALTLEDCYITGLLYLSGLSKPYLGGLIGRSNTGNAITIKNCTEENLILLSGDSEAGGLVGKMTNGSTNVSNVVFTNVTVATKQTNKYVGLLTGNTNGKTINGYNILANSCKVGYNTDTDVTIDNLSSSSLGNNNNTGLWLGNSSGTSVLVAVAVKGTNQPLKDVGNGTASITYADYPVDQNYKPNGTNGMPQSANPWLDVNPKSEVMLNDGTIMTGNGVGYITTTTTSTDEEGNVTTTIVKGNSIAQNILEEAKSAVTNKHYWNVKDASDTDQTFSQYLETTNSVYLTTYQTEEKNNGTSVPSTTDFPILVVNSTADADTEIWNYIAALTNVSTGSAAKDQAGTVTARTYRWDSTNGSFVRVNGTDTKDSLTVSNKIISVVPNAYDNQNSQFTLLDVKYTNPVDSSAKGFHLFVPVLVKKVLQTTFSASFLAGTNYLMGEYVPWGGYATAGFNEPVTAYMEYNYDRSKSEWEQMLNNGDNLLWNYEKVLDLASGSNTTEENTLLLPVNTRLTLVDKQTGKCYIYAFSAGDTVEEYNDSVHRFPLSQMKTVDGEAFKPAPICDLLGLEATENSDQGTYCSLGLADDTGNPPTGATVKVGSTYYRKATTEEISDETVTKYTITVGDYLTDNSEGTNYLPMGKGEGYYLTIQVPTTEGVALVNNPVNYYAKTMKGTDSAAPVALIRNGVPSSYVIYNGIQQSEFAISSGRYKNEVKQTEPTMENGDSIKVSLTSELSLTDTGQDQFKSYAPSELDHQFSIMMKKVLKDSPTEDALIGAVGASYTYRVSKKDNTELFSEEGTIPNSELMDELPIGCSQVNAKKIVEYLRNNVDQKLKITAVITLPYPNAGSYFPGRTDNDTETGIYAVGVTKVATSRSQLPITTNKNSKKDLDRYYTANPSNASLIYEAIDRSGANDNNMQLGINPDDNDYNRSSMISTEGIYDYSGLDAEELSRATHVRYRLELLVKGESGSYNPEPLSIQDYLPTVTESGGGTFTSADGGKSIYLDKEFTVDSSMHDFVFIDIVPLTGEGFESQGYTYANYKVRLTAVLLDGSNAEISSSKASDYIIYTNARVYQQMFGVN